MYQSIKEGGHKKGKRIFNEIGGGSFWRLKWKSGNHLQWPVIERLMFTDFLMASPYDQFLLRPHAKDIWFYEWSH